MCDPRSIILGLLVVLVILAIVNHLRRHGYRRVSGSFLPAPGDTYSCSQSTKASMCLVPRSQAEQLCSVDSKCVGYLVPGRTITAAALATNQPLDMVLLVGAAPMSAATGTPGYDYYRKPTMSSAV